MVFAIGVIAKSCFEETDPISQMATLLTWSVSK